MTPAGDPYRTLGLDPGATPTEIKRAYRRLAKAYHPDSAGERALPRFLAIQAAYERLTSGQPGAKSAGSAGPARRGTGQGPTEPPPSRPWSADAERARATRDAFRKRSTRTGPRAGSASSSAGSSAPGSGTRAGAGAGGPGTDGPGSAPRPGRGSRRGRPKATIGSTSYDGADAEPFEPGWSGAGWYGAASGTYWTINPKEYADPRKHGPEYLARARRGAKQPAAGTSPVDSGAAPDGGPPGAAAGAAREPESAPRPGPVQPAGSAATADPGDAASPSNAAGTSATATGAAAARPAARRPDASREPEPQAPAPAPAASATPQPDEPRRTAAAAAADAQPSRFAGLQPANVAGSWRGRLLLAALAWFPIGLAIFGIHGQVTGCSQFLASCTDPVAWSVWIPQAIVVALLLASPRLSWIAAAGSVVLFCVAVPLAAVLTAGSGGRPPSTEETQLLYAAMAIGWLAGVGIALSGRIPLPPWRAARVR